LSTTVPQHEHTQHHHNNGGDPGHEEPLGASGSSPPAQHVRDLLAEHGRELAAAFLIEEGYAGPVVESAIREAELEDKIRAGKPGGPRIVFEEDFAADWDAPEAPIAPIVPGLIYEGLVHWLSGAPGAGKSTLAANAALQAMRDGRHVVWLDFEAGRKQARRRVRAAGVTGELAATFFHYAQYPRIPADDAGSAELAGVVDRWPGALVVIDSASKALATAGLNENDNADTTAWTDSLVVKGLKEGGATVVVIDHVSKSSDPSNLYSARGAGSKLADCDIDYLVVKESAFKRDLVGQVRLVCHKDRDSVLSRELWGDSKHSTDGERWVSVGNVAGGLPVEPMEAPVAERETREDEGARVVAALVRVLREAGGPLNQGQVIGLVPGRDRQKIDALSRMAVDPDMPVRREIGGPGRPTTYAYVESAPDALDL